jgi:dolichyl-phosphate-mannose-protein mannosyltransferase
MVNSRAAIWMQLLAIVPTVIFLLIYTEEIAYKVLSLFLLILLGINLYKSIQNQKVLYYPLVLLLMGSFYIYVFYRVGTTQVPQTFHTLKESHGVTRFSFEKVQTIDKICYYVGIDKNVNFTLEYKAPKGWKKFYSYESAYPYSFKWRCIKKQVKTNNILLRVTKNEMMLNEIRFFHRNKTIPFKTEKSNLNDENTDKVDTGYYSGMFFDEIYFGRTAYEIMKGVPVYENTHPYLGKLLMTPGIKLLGMTPMGWRLMNALFAGFLIFIAYYFALQLFKKENYAFMSAFFMTYSFMHLAQARIALIDTFGVLFVFVSYYYLYLFIMRQHLSKLWISGVFFGMAAAVKWSAVFAALGFVLIAIYLLMSKYPLQKRFAGIRLIFYGAVSYGFLAFCVYVLSFYDIFAKTGSIQSIINYNINMFNYHSTLLASHPYSSPWWSWPLDMRPMGYYKTLKYGLLSTINVFGNPALFWVGILAIFYLFYASVLKKSLEASFILLAFVGLYLPYAFVGRLMFIYHFYYAVPFLILAIVYMLKEGMERFQWMQMLSWVYLVSVSALFVLFYPVLTGMVVQVGYVNQWLKWFSTWWF